MAGKLTLTYFKLPGRAFGIRLCLRAAGVEFTDEIVDYPGLVALRGPTGTNDRVPLGQLPVLTLPDGRHITQSTAILRWAGKKAGLYPTDPDQALIVDEILVTMDELFAKTPMDADPAVKKAKREEFMVSGMPKYFELVSKRLKESGGPFLTGSELTIADLSLFNTLHTLKTGTFDHIPTTYTAQWAEVDALYGIIKAHPLVVKHGNVPE